MSQVQPTQKPESPEPRTAEPRTSVRILTVFGIPVRAHFTFILFLVWVAFVARPQAAAALLFVLTLFLCVLLHELGHALTARQFGITTSDITLYPIGGIAVLGSKPKPNAEFWIALAGPLVNLVLAAALVPAILLHRGHLPPLAVSLPQQSFTESIFTANLMLALFNLVPAFPMDGGRVLRAILAMNLSEARATAIAGGVGQLIAFGLLFLGLFFGPLLMLIALFVMLGASQEVSASRNRSVLLGHRVVDAMQSQFRTIESGANLETAAQMLLEGSQHDFPVVAGEETIGLLTRNDIARGLATEGPSGYVAGNMRRVFTTINQEAHLEEALEVLSKEGPAPLLVMHEGLLAGMLTRENLSEFIMLEHARARSRPTSFRP